MRALLNIVMTRANKNYIVIIKVMKYFSFFSSCCFLKKVEKKEAVILSGYRNIPESLRELERLLKHSPAACVPTAFQLFS